MGPLRLRPGLFDIRMARGQSVLVGCGLGGTSLINANVALRASRDVFADDAWPVELRGEGRALLDPYYDRAEHMLGSRRYPDDVPDDAQDAGAGRAAAMACAGP